MIAEARQHGFIFPRERENLRPVVFASAIDNHARDAGFFTQGKQFTLATVKAVILQMVVRVVKFHFALAVANSRMRSQILDSALRRFGVRCCVIPSGARNFGSCARISAGA